MKPCEPPQSVSGGSFEDTIQTNILRREREPYDKMSRTAHPGVFLPRDILKDYKRREFLPYGQIEIKNDKFETANKTMSSFAQQTKLPKSKGSTGTMLTTATSTFKQTQQTFKKVTEFKI